MLLVKEAVYWDLSDIKHAINDRKSRPNHNRYIHIVTKGRVVVPLKLAAN